MKNKIIFTILITSLISIQYIAGAVVFDSPRAQLDAHVAVDSKSSAGLDGNYDFTYNGMETYTYSTYNLKQVQLTNFVIQCYRRIRDYSLGALIGSVSTSWTGFSQTKNFDEVDRYTALSTSTTEVRTGRRNYFLHYTYSNSAIWLQSIKIEGKVGAETISVIDFASASKETATYITTYSNSSDGPDDWDNGNTFQINIDLPLMATQIRYQYMLKYGLNFLGFVAPENIRIVIFRNYDTNRSFSDTNDNYIKMITFQDDKAGIIRDFSISEDYIYNQIFDSTLGSYVYAGETNANYDNPNNYQYKYRIDLKYSGDWYEYQGKTALTLDNSDLCTRAINNLGFKLFFSQDQAGTTKLTDAPSENLDTDTTVVLIN
jgi:hypothetical protein